MRKLFIVVAIFTLSILSFGKEYRRIASGSPAISEILYELGLKDSIVAMDKNSDVKGLENVSKVSFYNISMEEMLGLKADLVIFSTFNKAEKNSFVTLMEKNGTDVIYLPDITSIEDISRHIVALAHGVELDATLL
ncbi:ABC transporter substrate-binding protein, partial [uncultured Fusobacterium sp.]|uniref:ABC transporter substrate-binding protein n=1 Tax=uncultured Fusobacterium sp. TaxID=159267 RepID=UPI0025FA154C